MAAWSLDDIPWQAFDAARVKPELVSVIKAACMVEHNGYDYGRYLCEVFGDDAEFQQVARGWAEEEVQHGRALRKWAELADPAFDFDRSFAIFTTGYKLPLDVAASVRGSRSGELIARCVVETGTSSYYSAIKDYTDEPVLKAICARIAADEFRHYKLFYTYLKRYLEKEGLGFWGRLKVAAGRVAESEDDELAYAFYAANHAEKEYKRSTYARLYLAHAYLFYRSEHVEKMIAMMLKAVGLRANGRLHRLLHALAWKFMSLRASMLKGIIYFPNPSLRGAPATRQSS